MIDIYHYSISLVDVCLKDSWILFVQPRIHVKLRVFGATTQHSTQTNRDPIDIPIGIV